ncbi:sulfotransferase family protein [Litchfieldella qijiaojingensis]|nr:sulfotransferase [Halomonas qijiaojingensis]
MSKRIIIGFFKSIGAQFKKAVFYLNCYQYYYKENSNEGPFFIVGVGRSGTHFLCKILNHVNGLNDYYEGKESPLFFGKVTRKAVHNKRLTRLHIGYYRLLQSKVNDDILIDQTHPNLWHAEQLISAFPHAKFIVIERELEQVITSMKKHKYVSQWGEDFNKYPHPNPFLGTTKNNLEIYQNVCTLQRNVFKWYSHILKGRQLKNCYPHHVYILKYDDLSKNMDLEVTNLCNFLGVKSDYTEVEFNKDALTKKRNLTPEEKNMIKEAINMCMNIN